MVEAEAEAGKQDLACSRAVEMLMLAQLQRLKMCVYLYIRSRGGVGFQSMRKMCLIYILCCILCRLVVA